MADVFLSYAKADAGIARRVAKALEAAGLDVWWDADLPAHRAYSEIIEQRLQQAKAVLVLWSKEAAQSQWVRAEADFARNGGKLVQAQLDAQLPPMPFNQIQCADLKGWRGGGTHAGWAKLLSSIKALVSGEEQPPIKVAEERWWQRPSARWAAVAAALVLVIAAGLLFLGTGPFSPGEPERPVVAVLPFESLDQRDSSLVAGIWEDTRQALSRNPQLLVLGPNTSEALADDPKKARRAADYLVEASVRSAGDRIRVSANLVRTDDGAQLWSESFERRLDDLFRLQQQIAGEIEGRIRGRLAERGGTLPEHHSTSGEVYALYSDARAKIRGRRFAEYMGATKQLEQVVRMDPNFAPGWATLAVARLLGAGVTTGGSAEGDARRAIALAPNLAAGHAALGFALHEGPAAEAALRRALALDPNDIEALNWLANSIGDSRYEERLRLYSRVVEIEPLWWPAIINKLNLLTEFGDPNAAQSELERVEKLGDTALAAMIRVHIATEKGDLSEAVNRGLAYYKSAPREEREMIGNLIWGPLVQLGRFDLADQVVAPPPQAADYIPYLRAGDPRAIEIIEERMGPREFWNIPPLTLIAGRVYLLNGQGAGLARQYSAVASTPAQLEQIIGGSRLFENAPQIALALRSVGDEDKARELLERAETLIPKTEKASTDDQVLLARIYAVQGRTDEAIGLLVTAVRRGWLPPFLPVHMDIALDPPLAELRGDPRFERIRQQILGHLKKERAELGPVTLN